MSEVRHRLVRVVKELRELRGVREDRCWLWVGAIDRDGYGRLHRGTTHRFSYELFVGPIPQGLVIDHLCRARNCVNPRHLEAVTVLENTRRGYSPSTISGRTNRCFRGHEYTEENTYVYKNRRSCRTCRRMRQLKWQQMRAVKTEVTP